MTMKKKIFFISLAFSGLLLQVKAQKADTIRAKASYEFIHLSDTTQKDNPHTEEMILLIGTNASVYASMDKIHFDEARLKDLEQQLKNSAPGTMNIKMNAPRKRFNGDELYQFTTERKLITKKNLINNYLIEEPQPDIKWTITQENSIIAGLNCQKATTRFKGRDYVAWFCQDIPFQTGPWKLTGLPGLIVEAYDTRKEVVFKFKGFEEVKKKANEAAENSDLQALPEAIRNGTMKITGLSTGDLLHNTTISLPKNAIKTTEREFTKLQEAMKKDPTGFINSSLAGSGNFKINKNNSSNTFKTEVINNPIELPETK